MAGYEFPRSSSTSRTFGGCSSGKVGGIGKRHGAPYEVHTGDKYAMAYVKSTIRPAFVKIAISECQKCRGVVSTRQNMTKGIPVSICGGCLAAKGGGRVAPAMPAL